MKVLRFTTVILFLLILLLPIANFNLEANSVSAIDNRKLTENPFSESAEQNNDLTMNIQNYVNDRIGFRDEMIQSYTVLNDRLFGKMVHPTYIYGKEGYVFGAGLTTSNEFGEFHIAFADMVAQMQLYCERRSIPFLFVFNPAKPAVLRDYIADGINYDRSWVDDFLKALDVRGVHYLDNTQILREKTKDGEVVYNQKYDANHWNDLGAFYGCNNILKALQLELPTIHINREDEIVVEERIETSLPVSNFPIAEAVPAITVQAETENITERYAEELERHPSYQTIGYYVNQQRKAEGAPKALVFQGSYMNGFGYKYLANGFGEYIHVHDYQNVLRLPYYFNIFQPDCVVFEVAEYTFSDTYFDLEAMQAVNFQSTVKEAEKTAVQTQQSSLSVDDLHIERGDTLTQLFFSATEEFESAWLVLKQEYDMEKVEGGYVATVHNVDYDGYDGNLKIVLQKDSELTVFS